MPTLSAVSQSAQLPEIVQQAVKRFESRWWESSTDLPQFSRLYFPAEQRRNEQRLQHMLNTILAAARRPLRSEEERQQAMAGLESMVTEFACECLGFEERHLQAMRSYGFTEATSDFARQARQFDPHISDDDILQASRNVWSMNFIQVLMGRKAEITPAVMAYSLLYPYTDNYLDDPNVSSTVKRAFNQRFARRLMGEQVLPANHQEQMIGDLIGMIEGQFERSQHPLVYASLLEILKSQARSVTLIRPQASPYELDVLGMCFEKGGTSVLADGYLIAGDVTPAEFEFLFYYGCLTQLVDDLEDTRSDRQAGLNTIFSLTARHWPLDGVTNRTLNFGSGLAPAMDAFGTPGLEPLKELIGSSMQLLLVDEVGRARGCYSPAYVAQLEACFPFRFKVLEAQRRRIERQRPALGRLLAGLMQAEPIISNAGSLTVERWKAPKLKNPFLQLSKSLAAWMQFF